MKNLIQDLINKSGLSNKEFADSVGTSASYLSQKKQFKHVDIEKLITWAKIHDIQTLEEYSKEYEIIIKIKQNENTNNKRSRGIIEM